MTARPFLPAFLSILVAACWIGTPFYTAAETRTPIPPGEYRSIPLGETEPGGEKVKVSIAAGGLTRIDSLDNEEKPSLLGFAELDRDGRWFVGWFLVGDDRKPGDEVAYFLLERGEGEFHFFTPNCDANRDIAIAAGATVVPDKKAAMCRFRERTQLETALMAAEGRLHQGVRLVPVASATGLSTTPGSESPSMLGAARSDG